MRGYFCPEQAEGAGVEGQRGRRSGESGGHPGAALQLQGWIPARRPKPLMSNLLRPAARIAGTARALTTRAPPGPNSWHSFLTSPGSPGGPRSREKRQRSQRRRLPFLARLRLSARSTAQDCPRQFPESSLRRWRGCFPSLGEPRSFPGPGQSRRPAKPETREPLGASSWRPGVPDSSRFHNSRPTPPQGGVESLPNPSGGVIFRYVMEGAKKGTPRLIR